MVVVEVLIGVVAAALLAAVGLSVRIITTSTNGSCCSA